MSQINFGKSGLFLPPAQTKSLVGPNGSFDFHDGTITIQPSHLTYKTLTRGPLFRRDETVFVPFPLLGKLMQTGSVF